MAQDAFISRHALHFESNDPIFISELDPSILGYEMLMVSSNNTAVQNFSQELPLRSQLDPSFQHASYLKKQNPGIKRRRGLGLISATLGNKENCRRFVENAFMTKGDAEGQSRIWEWVDDYQGPSFSEARDAFIAMKNRQEKLSTELELLAFLHDEIGNCTVESYCAAILEELSAAEEETERLNAVVLPDKRVKCGAIRTLYRRDNPS
jgi:hypothetical protein